MEQLMDEVKMSVSSATKKDGKLKIYVLFTVEKKMAEFLVPDEKMVYNSGFSEEETKALLQYVHNNMQQITEMAKEINPIKAFMQ